jgi:LPS sulfotransferase NodH
MRRNHKDYQKFVIIAYPRSGSTWLQTSLHSHEEMNCYGSGMFNLSIKYKEPDGYNKILKYPTRYIKKEIFKKYPSNIKAVGLKLIMPRHGTESELLKIPFFLKRKDILSSVMRRDRKKIQLEVYDHITANYNLRDLKKRSQETLTYLIKTKDIKIIYLKRENGLRWFSSVYYALKSGKFEKINEKKYNFRPFKLSVNDFKYWLGVKEKYEKFYEKLFDNSRTKTIYYEDMLCDKDKVLKEVQDYVGVEPKRLTFRTLL